MGGHAENMRVILQNNLILRNRYRDRHNTIYDALHKEMKNHPIHPDSIPREERERIKNKIRTSIRRKNMISFIKTIFLTAIVACLILYFLFSSVFAQGIVSENNTWNVYVTGYPSFIGTESYKIEGDSVQNGYNYKIIWLTMDSVDASWSYQGLMREDSNIVFFVPPMGTEGILYNFNLAVGDTCSIKNMFCGDESVPILISMIDTIEYLGVQRRRWHLDEYLGFFDFWIEGIGGSLGPIHSKYYMCIVCPTWDLLCFHRNDSLLYMREGFDACYVHGTGLNESEYSTNLNLFPNPARDKIQLQSSGIVEFIEVFDLSGRKVIEKHFPAGIKDPEVVLSDLKSGMYVCKVVMNGKTFIRKFICSQP